MFNPIKASFLGEPASRARKGADHHHHGEAKDRIIIMANWLPVHAIPGPNGWSFNWNQESLLLQLKDGLPDAMEVLYVGFLPMVVDPAEKDNITATLLNSFNCLPTFLPPNLNEKFYHGFCKQWLFPLLHSKIPSSNRHGRVFDRSLWEAYVQANNILKEHVRHILIPERDYIWIHDYHLMLLPMLLREMHNNLRIGFFLYSPFPSSEIFRSLPVREELIRCLLNCDLIGFHSYHCVWHFLEVCRELMGLEHHLIRGYIGLEYFGRTIGINISPVGIHLPQFGEAIGSEEVEFRLSSLKKQFAGKTVLLGIDHFDLSQGIDLKLLAFEHMLEMYSSLQGKAVLVQIVKPPWSREIEIVEKWNEIQNICKRINEKFGGLDYHPVVYIKSGVSLVEKIAYYAIAECLVVAAVRDEMILTPYEYVICREEVFAGDVLGALKTSTLVVSEFIRCLRSLSSAIWINPWNIISTAEAMHKALTDSGTEKYLRHEKHYSYVFTHDVAHWSKSFFEDLQRSCKDHFRKRFSAFGSGLGFKVVSLDPEFNKLSCSGNFSKDYGEAKRRVIFLDYDNTLMPQEDMDKKPSEELITVLNSLTAGDSTVVYIVSGKPRGQLAVWFHRCKKLGIAAEHGYFIRSSAGEEWETCCQNSDFRWMQMVEPLLKHYTESTHGSHIEITETALVWHHKAADPYFGPLQARHLLDHLERDLAEEPVEVKTGKSTIEIRPKGIGKGLIVEKILKRVCAKWGKAVDFVLCLGDDCSDEDLFDSIISVARDGKLVTKNASVFACTIAQNSGGARYFPEYLASLDD